MIEGGDAGGSARAQAEQRRATADRLLAEAGWLERVANDEQLMAVQLGNLPTAYAILHDLRVPGSKGNIDHVVVGPGGAFLVVTRRYSQAISFHDDQLFAGDVSLKGDLDTARVEGQLLTKTLGTPVMPIVGLLGSMVPNAAPPQMDGVLVCAGDTVARTITRASHTLLAPNRVADATERAMPLLNTPGAVTRTAPGPIPEPVSPVTYASSLLPPALSADSEPLNRRAANRRESPASVIAAAATSNGRRSRKGTLPTPSAKPARKPAVASKPGAKPAGKPATKPGSAEPTKGERSGGARSARFVAASIVSLCLLALAVGSLVRVLGRNWPGDTASAGVGATSTQPSSSEVAGSTTLAPVAPPPAALTFASACPQPGAGWNLVPTWPGDRTGLVSYDLETLNPDGTWTLAASMTSAATAGQATLVHEPPNTAVTARLTVVMADGGRTTGAPVTVNTPATGC